MRHRPIAKQASRQVIEEDRAFRRWEKLQKNWTDTVELGSKCRALSSLGLYTPMKVGTVAVIAGVSQLPDTP